MPFFPDGISAGDGLIRCFDNMRSDLFKGIITPQPVYHQLYNSIRFSTALLRDFIVVGY
ncbi:MAG TPA: hypothetical protein VHB70_12995 [Parafilimonas sp.]|nr:hypothetical protein [Parafilimonas sp.]